MPGHIDAFDPVPEMGSAVGSKDFGGDLRDRPAPSSITGTGTIEQSKGFRDFLAETGRSATNPYGNESTFQKLTGLKNLNYLQPDVPGGLTLEGIARLNRLAYDKFMSPFAKQNILGSDVGGDMLRGKVRSDIRPGTLTRFGMTEAAPSRGGFFQGIASFIPGIGTAMNMNRPAVLPDFDMAVRSNVPGYDGSKLAQLQRLSPEIGTASVEGLPPLSELLADDTAFTNRETAGETSRSSDPLSEMFGYDMVPGQEEIELARSEVPEGDTTAFVRSQGVYPSDRAMIDPEMEQSVQTTGDMPLNTPPAFQQREVFIGPLPESESRLPEPRFPIGTGAYDAKLDEMQPRSDALRASLSEAERAELDAIRARNELIDSSVPSISDVISGTSAGQPLNLIQPGFSTIGTNIVSEPVLNYPSFTEMMRRRRGDKPIIAQPFPR